MLQSRNQRAETRNRVKDELKRAINSVDKVRRWEKKWIVVKDTTMKIFKWVPVSGQTNSSDNNALRTAASLKSALAEDEEASGTAVDLSGENSREALGSESGTATQLRTFGGLNEEDSNTGFSETGFETDSNQAFDGVRYQPATGASTDFSALRQAEIDHETVAAVAAATAATANDDDDDDDDDDAPPSVKRLKDM